MNPIPFFAFDWNAIEKVEHRGETGIALWQTVEFEGLRIRIVEYSEDYRADHWCTLGHIVYCLEGEFVSELSNGEQFKLSKGMSYIVSDGASSHRSVSANGSKLLIVDGNFLKK